MLQAIFEFRGVQQVQGGVMVTSHGVLPSTGFLRILPQFGLVADVADLVLTFGRIRIVWPDCRVNRPNVQKNAETGATVAFQLEDRRWKWDGTGKVTGRYNVRKPNGELDEDTEKAPQEMLSLLLDALGERNYDVSAVPNDSRPYQSWDHVPAAAYLESLCELLGCRVVYQPRMGTQRDRILIARAGKGAALPFGGRMLDSYGITTPRKPDSLELICGPTFYQSLLELEAVGLDSDGLVKPIDELLYRPTAGWEGEDPTQFSNVVGDTTEEYERNRQLALFSVFRWYRVKQQATGDMDVPGYGTIDKIDQILPLSSTILETFENTSDPDAPRIEQYTHAYVMGEYYDENQAVENAPFGTRYDGDFRVNGAEGRIECSKAVYRVDGEDNKPASLFLMTSYSVRETETGQPKRVTQERDLPGKKHGTGAKLVRREDIFETHIASYEVTAAGDTFALDEVTDTIAQTEEAVRFALDAAELEYAVNETVEMEFQGVVPIPLDGANHQVQYRASHKAPATTRVSRNTEHYLMAPPYSEKRRQMETAQRLLEQKQELIEARRALRREGKVRRYDAP